jgi:hypothetical protein
LLKLAQAEFSAPPLPIRFPRHRCNEYSLGRIAHRSGISFDGQHQVPFLSFNHR